MDPKRYQLVKQILMEAMEAEPDQLAQILDRLCGDDTALREEVSELLTLNVGATFLADTPVITELPDVEHEDLTGQIGRINIEHLLARGGMGDVYAGTDDLLGRPVAIKIMSKDLRFSPARRTAFLNEAKILSHLQHPNICQIYDFFEARDRDVLVMELIEGYTLRTQLQNDDITDANDLARQLAAALSTAHERGISHHDLKPENIMITPQNQLKVLDFGLARSDHNTEDTDKTGVSGTPAYMSPEQARAEQMTSASDIWSMGIILVELWAGQQANNNQLSKNSLIELASQAKGNLPKDLPKAETDLLHAMLHTDATKRISARQVLNQLYGIIERPKRRLKYTVVLAFFTLALLSGWKYTIDLKHERSVAIIAKDQAIKARSDAEDLIAYMLNDLREGLQSVGKIELLESVANQAMAYYGELDPTVMRSTLGQPAVALTRVGEVFDFQGRKADAIKVLKQAEDALQELHHEFPQNHTVAFRLGMAQTVLGENYKLDGQFDAALQVLEQAISLGEFITTDFNPGAGTVDHPNGYERWQLLLKSQYLYADVFMRMGAGERAVDLLEKAVIPARKAAQHEPKLMPNLADIEFKRCDTYYDIPIKELMLEPCLAILEMDRLLHLAEPENYRLHSNYALDYIVVARVYETLGELNLAVEHANESVRLMEQLVAWDPGNASRQNDLVLTLSVQGRMLYKQGNMAASEQVFKRAKAINEPSYQNKKEITVMNNAFAIYLHLNEMAKAREVALRLKSMGFNRRDYRELCVEFDIQECFN